MDITTEAQARALLENIAKENPSRWPAAVQTVAVAAIANFERLAVEHKELQAKFEKLVLVLAALRGKPAPASARPAGQPVKPAAAQPAQPVSSTGDPAQDAAEAEMEAAIGAAEAAPPSDPVQAAAEAEMEAAMGGNGVKAPTPMPVQPPANNGSKRPGKSAPAPTPPPTTPISAK